MSPRAEALRCAIDLVCITYDADVLAVLFVRSGPGASRRIPSAPVGRSAALSQVAARLCEATIGRAPLWCEQAGTLVSGAHQDNADVSITFVATIPRELAAQRGVSLCAIARLPARIPARTRAAIDAAVMHLRVRAVASPALFGMLPSAFALGDLQRIYEVLHGRRIHKASFRRALRAAGLVQRTAAQRMNLRGRPAQLYRYAPAKKRGAPRGIRFG